MLKTIRELGVKLSLVFDKSKVDVASKAIADLTTGMKAVALGVGGATASLLGLAGAASSNARDLDQNSKALGINVERLQELQYAAKVAAGVSKEELNGALEGLSKTLFEARNNNVEAGQTLIRLGVPIDMLTDKSITADQVMMKLADNISKLPDGMYKTALAQEAFGGSGARLLPLLNKGAEGIAKMGAEGRALGVVLSSEVIKKGAEFDRQWTKIWLVMKNITYLIGHDLIKYLYPMIVQIQKWIVQNRQLIAMGLAVFFKTLGDALSIIFKGVLFLANGLKYLVNAMGGVANATKILTSLLLGLAVGPFGLLGAAIAGLFLILQDLFSDNSIIKEWANSFAEKFPGITKLFQGLLAQVLVLPERISHAFDIVKEALKDTVAVFEWGFGKIKMVIDIVLGALDDSVKIFETVFLKWTGISKALNLPSFEDLKGKAKGVWESMKGLVSNAPSTVGGALIQNAQERIGPSYGHSAPVQNNQMTANINVTVPKGTSAVDAEKIVSKGTEQGFLQTLRHTRNQFIGGLVY